MKTVLHVVGARPNFMKVAPIYRALARGGRLIQRLVHTGQHYDERMSEVFFRELGLPPPDLHLGVGSGSHAEQTAKVLMAMERVLLEERPALVSVVGDVNSTLAAGLAAAKLGIRVAHVEAGLRSFDRTMPEEINRLVVDRLADHLLTPSADADANLVMEGVEPERIHRVGNVMIDTLLESLPAARERDVLGRLGVEARHYAVCTLHRAGNVDDPAVLGRILEGLRQVARRLPVVFPVHPRTSARLLELAGQTAPVGTPTGAETRGAIPGLITLEPLGYLDFLCLTSQAALVLTDSGGLQEESTALGVPCLTLRENTERPVTVDEGTNTLVGSDPAKIAGEALAIIRTGGKRGRIPALWDGKTAERIAELYGRIA